MRLLKGFTRLLTQVTCTLEYTKTCSKGKKLAIYQSFLGIEENFDFTKVRVNKTKSEVEDIPDIESRIQEFYNEVYEYCNDMFPVTKELWR